VLDTGVESSHSFLSGQIVDEACYSSAVSGATTLCPGGTSPDFGSGAASPSQCTSIANCDHGTHIAGITVGNGTTFDGVAPGAKVMPIQTYVKIADSLTCALNGQPVAPCILSYTSDQISALQYVFANYDNNNVVAVNLSAGSGSFSGTCDSENTAFNAAVDQLAGVQVAVIASSGDGYLTNSLTFPACISNVISVGATTKADAVADFSNSASTLDLLAPGVNITSSLISGFGSMNGTSQAAAHVSGAWAILKSAFANLTIDQILTAFKSTGVAITDPRNSISRHRIDVGEAYQSLNSTDMLALFNTDLNLIVLMESLQDWPTYPDMYTTYEAGTSVLGQWVMGDWDGDGVDTPGVYSEGAFWYTNFRGNTPSEYWFGMWLGPTNGKPIAGSWDGADRDCIGLVVNNIGVWWTCQMTETVPTMNGQWLGGQMSWLTGDYQFMAGDWNGDGIDTVAMRRDEYITWTNVPTSTVLAEFTQAQYIGAPGSSYGIAVSGDWDQDEIDSFGLFYNDSLGSFYRRNDLDWNSEIYIIQHVGQPIGTNVWATAGHK
jgi:hypothetical protein